MQAHPGERRAALALQRAGTKPRWCGTFQVFSSNSNSNVHIGTSRQFVCLPCRFCLLCWCPHCSYEPGQSSGISPKARFHPKHLSSVVFQYSELLELAFMLLRGRDCRPTTSAAGTHELDSPPWFPSFPVCSWLTSSLSLWTTNVFRMVCSDAASLPPPPGWLRPSAGVHVSRRLSHSCGNISLSALDGG